MIDPSRQTVADAIQNFRDARRKAALQDIMARLTGQPINLLSFDEVREKFRLEGGSSLGLQEVPLDAIVGSVSRYKDFNRHFLPRLDSDERRWADVMAVQLDLSGLPPIDLYKLGDAYFVVDGNHRVSVARQLNAPTIQAYVTEFKLKVPLTPDDDPDTLILKAEYASFLDKTKLDKLRPETNLEITTPGRYWILETQIEARQLWLSRQQDREVSYPEAVIDWHDQVYLPVIDLIEEKGILRDFPGRAITDMYLWIFQHRAELIEKLGWEVDAESAANSLLEEYSPVAERVLARVSGKLRDSLLPEPLETGPETGQWRRDWLEARPRDRLFGNILVPVDGQEASWVAVKQALSIAKLEGGQLYGLYVEEAAGPGSRDKVKTIRTGFQLLCGEAGVPGRLAVTEGDVVEAIVGRARWVDLVVANPRQIPSPGVLNRIGSRFRAVVQRSPRPVFVLRGSQVTIERALLGYDGSPKAQEGLYVATYLAQRYQTELVIATVTKSTDSPAQLDLINRSLAEQPVQFRHLVRSGPVTDTLLHIAAEQKCDLIIMGGFGLRPLLSTMLGSTVDDMLAQSTRSILICR